MIATLLDNLIDIATPIFLVAAFGFIWARTGKPFDTPTVSTLVMQAAVPCLILVTMVKVELPEAVLAEMALATVLVHLAAAAIGAVALAALRLPTRAFLPGMIFTNSTNVGLPVCLFAYGQEGLTLGLAYVVVSLSMLSFIGVPIAAGRFDAKEFLRTPIMWAICIALPLMLLDVDLPLAVERTLRIMGDMVIPVMLVTLGVSLSRLKVRRLGISVLLGAARIGLGFAIGLGTAWALGMEGTARGVLVLQAAMPAAVLTYFLALSHGGRPDEAAGLVMTSTLMMFPLLPFMLLAL